MTNKTKETASNGNSVSTTADRMQDEYRALFESSRDAIMLLDKDCFFDCNRATLKLFGCPSKDVFITKHPADLSPPKQPNGENSFSAALAHIERAYMEETDFFEWVHARLDGTPFYAEVLLSQLKYQGRMVLQATVRDITERKQAEEDKERRTAELILANQELQRLNEEKVKRAAELMIANKLNREKSKFFSIIAHDLRSPFNGFLGLTQIMAEEFSNLTVDEMQKLAVRMKDSAADLFQLLEDLLQWAIMQQGLIPFKPEAVDLQSVVIGILSMVQSVVQNKNIETYCIIPDNMAVWADKNMLQTVIRNLVTNAIKFTPVNGKIAINATPIADNRIEISVQDSGIGMNRELLNNLFQFDEITHRNGIDGEHGLGLGLLLCKEFVEKHEGKIWVESEEGKGTRFHFTIPYNPELEIVKITEDTANPDDQEKYIRPLKILIADDDEQSEILISIFVKKFCKELLSAKTGIKTLEMCRNNADIDLVLLDLDMPEMDGYEVAREIRKFNKTVVIIAQTAYTLTREREKAIGSGCNDYIEKPFNKSSLTVLLNKYF